MSISSSPYRQPTARRLALALAVAGAALAPACAASNSSTSTGPTPVLQTETFTGTLPALGSVTYLFPVAANGPLAATLTSFSPQTSITVGLAVGYPSGSTCQLVSLNESARVGSVISGTAAPGSYCAVIYDLGNATGPNDFVITITHY